jgi:hypothetical protein
MPLRSLYRCTNMHIFSSKARDSVALPLPWSQPHHAHASRQLQNKETFFAAAARASCQQILAESQHLLRAAAPPPQGIEAMGVQGSIFRQQDVRSRLSVEVKDFFFFFLQSESRQLASRTQSSRRALCSLLADDDDDDSESRKPQGGLSSLIPQFQAKRRVAISVASSCRDSESINGIHIQQLSHLLQKLGRPPARPPRLIGSSICRVFTTNRARSGSSIFQKR